MPIQDFIVEDDDGVPRLIINGGNQNFLDFIGSHLEDLLLSEDDLDDLEDCVTIELSNFQFREEDMAQIAAFLGPLEIYDIKFGENCPIDTPNFYSFIETFWNRDKAEICISFTDPNPSLAISTATFSYLKETFRFAQNHQSREVDEDNTSTNICDVSRNLEIYDIGLFIQKVCEKLSTPAFQIDPATFVNNGRLFSNELLHDLECWNEAETEAAADEYVERIRTNDRNAEPCKSAALDRGMDDNGQPPAKRPALRLAQEYQPSIKV